MSKTIIIQKNGVAQTLTVDKLRLPDAAGGTENWLPADGKNLVNLEVKQNGTYRASDFSAYGIAEVKVKCTLNGGAAVPKATEKLLNALHHPAPAEGGRARTMSAHHLETTQDGGGTVQWVPEEEVALGTKSVNVDNRTYKASDDGKYGYSEFTVSGISITKDGDTITHTDGTGTKTYTLPHHIRVEHPPLKIAYVDGETIDFSGMLVKAYNEDGTVWTDETHPGGVIPLNELILSVTVADIESVHADYFTDGYGVNAKYIAYTQRWDYDWHPIEYSLYASDVVGEKDDTPVVFGNGSPGAPASMLITKYNGGLYAMGLSDPTKMDLYYFRADWATMRYQMAGGATYFTTKDAFTMAPWGDYVTVAPESTADPTNAGQMLPVNPFQEIPVQWARPWDGEILEDSFDIHVSPNPGYGGAEGGGGQTSGGGAGRDN
ncbi:MAG: hypothetical protein IKE76_05050 [Clostridia bacterium]|nr:hypothetical protein [Clostridia bacterium]